MVDRHTTGKRLRTLAAAKFGVGVGELTPQDREKLDLTKKIRALQGHGCTWEDIAKAVGKTKDAVVSFCRHATYRRCCEYLDIEEQAAAPPRMNLTEKGDVAPEDMVQLARQAFAQLAPDTIEFYQDCYRRNPEELWPTLGKWHDPALAQWAAERVSKGLGLLEPEHAARPIITIHLGTIHSMLAQVSEEDRRNALAINVSPTSEG